MTDRSDTEPDLLPLETLAAFQRGDEEAFLAVRRTFAEAVRGWTRRFFISASAQNDAGEDIWSQAFDRRAASSGADLRPWLRRIAFERCEWRRQTPEGRVAAVAADLSPRTPDDLDRDPPSGRPRTTGPHAIIGSADRASGPIPLRPTGPHPTVRPSGPHPTVRTTGAHATVGDGRPRRPTRSTGPIPFPIPPPPLAASPGKRLAVIAGTTTVLGGLVLAAVLRRETPARSDARETPPAVRPSGPSRASIPAAPPTPALEPMVEPPDPATRIVRPDPPPASIRAGLTLYGARFDGDAQPLNLVAEMPVEGEARLPLRMALEFAYFHSLRPSHLTIVGWDGRRVRRYFPVGPSRPLPPTRTRRPLAGTVDLSRGHAAGPLAIFAIWSPLALPSARVDLAIRRAAPDPAKPGRPKLPGEIVVKVFHLDP